MRYRASAAGKGIDIARPGIGGNVGQFGAGESQRETDVVRVQVESMDLTRGVGRRRYEEHLSLDHGLDVRCEQVLLAAENHRPGRLARHLVPGGHPAEGTIAGMQGQFTTAAAYVVDIE